MRLGFTAAAIAAVSAPFAVAQGQTIAEIMVTNPNFTKIERYLNFTGLMSILDEPDVNVTFFAPDNEAFLFLEDAGLAALLLTGFWIEHTECVIAGHFVDGIIDSSQLSDGLVLPTFEENENITVNLNPPRVSSTGRGANITRADIVASNGLIHEIDRTMLPTCMTKTIGTIAREDSRFSILLELADLAPGVNFSNPIGLTVFAPTDDAFLALGDEILDFLKQPENLPYLESTLLHHAFNGNIYSTGLLNVVPTRSTSVEGTSAYWYLDDDVLEINGASVIEADILGRNGVFHVIDEVMVLPSIPAFLENIPEFTVDELSFTELLGALVLADLASVLEIDDVNDPTLWTLLAPTNDAFANAPAALGKFTQEGWIDTHLAEILLYHVVSGSFDSTAVTSVDSIEMVNGDSVSVSVDGANVEINNASVVSVDHFPYNGVIHALDEILIPSTMTQTIAEIAAGNDDFSTLVSLVTEAGLLEALQGEGPLTVFAPTNAAFAAVTIPDDADVTDILLYHVAGENVILEDGKVVTMLNDDDVVLTVTEMENKVNGANIDGKVLASNGIVYVVDAVLLPPEDATASPTPSTTDPPPTPATTEPPTPSGTPSLELVTPVDYEGCMKVNGTSVDDTPLYLATCVDSDSSQKFSFDGQYLHPGGDVSKCLQAGRSNFPMDGNLLRVYACDPTKSTQKFVWDGMNGAPLKLADFEEYCVVFRGTTANVDIDPIIIKKCADIEFMRRGWIYKP